MRPNFDCITGLNVTAMKTIGSNSLKISERDMEFLLSLGDSEMGFVIRGEVAEMYCVPVEEVDALVLTKINGNELD